MGNRQWSQIHESMRIRIGTALRSLKVSGVATGHFISELFADEDELASSPISRVAKVKPGETDKGERKGGLTRCDLNRFPP